MQAFSIRLKNEKAKTYKLIILFFVILHIVFFIYFCFNSRPWTVGSIAFIIIADIFLIVLGKIALQNTAFNFNTSSIEKLNFPLKTYSWDEFSNIVVKDNILTMDFKNNKLFQAEIETINSSEEAFNTFAKQQLNKI